MELLGDRNWWMPRWLDRVLPVLDVEASGSDTEPASSDAPGDADVQDDRLITV